MNLSGNGNYNNPLVKLITILVLALTLVLVAVFVYDQFK